MIDFGELRSACHGGQWSFELWQWITAHKVIEPDSIEIRYAYGVAGRALRNHDLLLAAIAEVQQGEREKIASVVYLILAGGHREHWMRHTMACLQGVEHETTNAADLVWWMCSHAPDLHKRILDAGHTCDEDLVWEFLAQFAYWELVRPDSDWDEYASPDLVITLKDPKSKGVHCMTVWPTVPDNAYEHTEEVYAWCISVSMVPQSKPLSTVTDCSHSKTHAAQRIIESTRKAMRKNA